MIVESIAALLIAACASYAWVAVATLKYGDCKAELEELKASVGKLRVKDLSDRLIVLENIINRHR
jgi:hypothetical protein